MYMLVQTRNKGASEFQLVTCIYLLACGASCSLFDILNHAGFSLSYSLAMGRIKELGEEQVKKMQMLVREQCCMVVWDNINIAFRVSEQRAQSKDHFDNGTTATLIPLYNVAYGSIPLSALRPRTSRCPVHNLNPLIDFLPTGQQVAQVEHILVWHIEEILLDAYPMLRTRFFEDQFCPPDVLSIPVHRTEQYPLPAALIDESTIDGTLDVIDYIFFQTLELTEEELKAHGPFLSAGDQLSVVLTDTVHDLICRLLGINIFCRLVLLNVKIWLSETILVNS